MKKLLTILSFALLAVSPAAAQKFSYVDTEFILSRIPDYNAAQTQLDQLSVQWQDEIEAKFAEIDKLYKAYQAEQILLTEEMKRKRENEIITKEKEAKDLQKQRFGVDGELFKKRQELVKPIQDKIYNAIREICTRENIAVMFDKSSSTTMLYTNPRYDKSKDVLQALGIVDK